VTVTALKRDVSDTVAAAWPGGAGRNPSGVLAWNLAALQRHHAAYLTSARRILGCPAQAEDVVQDVMLRLVADPPEAGAGSQTAYVGRMVRNLALDRARRGRGDPLAREAGVAVPGRHCPAHDVPSVRLMRVGRVSRGCSVEQRLSLLIGIIKTCRPARFSKQ
jgi:DNA-directed RNA polymerase specialized sigma24 family protein